MKLIVELDRNKRENKEFTIYVEQNKLVAFLIKIMIERKMITVEEAEQFDIFFGDKLLNNFY